MIARIKNVFNRWREDRQHLRELLIKLENLTDPTFLFRAEHDITFSDIDKFRALTIYGLDLDRL